jgi:formaldehyde-activating enzyme involved in methanogenesis
MSAALSNSTPARASEEVRRANKKARDKRESWRENYRATTSAIRKLKKERAKNRTNNRELNITLRAMQTYATTLLIQQQVLKQILRDTAYPYV